MQQKIETQSSNYFLPQILSIQEQKNRLKCPNHNLAYSTCISSQCSLPGLMCLDVKCQCRKLHYKCHHILLDRILDSIQKHQKQIPQKAKETYQTIYEKINQMIEQLSKLRAKFEKEEQYFGLREQQLNLMDLIYQQKIDDINGKIISSLEKTFDTQIQLNKMTKQQIIKDFQEKNNQFNNICNYIEQNYLQIKLSQKTSKISKRFIMNQNLFSDSKIVQNKQQVQMLNKWLKESFKSCNKPLKSQLLFRASQYDYKAEKFHEKCDGIDDTIVIVKNQYDKIIGGFTSIPWSSKGVDHHDQTNRSFLFSLNLKQKFQYINTHSRSIACYSSCGPIFGDGPGICRDLQIVDKCNTENCIGWIGNTFNIQINHSLKYNYESHKSKTLFTGSSQGKFKIKQYEVYQITQ